MALTLESVKREGVEISWWNLPVRKYIEKPPHLPTNHVISIPKYKPMDYTVTQNFKLLHTLVTIKHQNLSKVKFPPIITPPGQKRGLFHYTHPPSSTLLQRKTNPSSTLPPTSWAKTSPLHCQSQTTKQLSMAKFPPKKPPPPDKNKPSSLSSPNDCKRPKKTLH